MAASIAEPPDRLRPAYLSERSSRFPARHQWPPRVLRRAQRASRTHPAVDHEYAGGRAAAGYLRRRIERCRRRLCRRPQHPFPGRHLHRVPAPPDVISVRQTGRLGGAVIRSRYGRRLRPDRESRSRHGFRDRIRKFLQEDGTGPQLWSVSRAGDGVMLLDRFRMRRHHQSDCGSPASTRRISSNQ